MVIVSGPVEFQMGEGETQHRERIARSFAIASKEVTVEQFDMFLEDSPRNRGDNKQNISPFPTCPVNSISWYLAAAYCNWLSNREGIPKDEWCYYPNDNGDYHVGMKLVSNPEYRTGYRLPTEAEW
jgi:formylglycine-generating enzyme required for sulfatase activity